MAIRSRRNVRSGKRMSRRYRRGGACPEGQGVGANGVCRPIGKVNTGPFQGGACPEGQGVGADGVCRPIGKVNTGPFQGGRQRRRRSQRRNQRQRRRSQRRQ